MKPTLVVLAAIALALGTEIFSQSTEQTAPLRIFLRGGPKTHGPAGNGLHERGVGRAMADAARLARREGGQRPAVSTTRAVGEHRRARHVRRQRRDDSRRAARQPRHVSQARRRPRRAARHARDGAGTTLVQDHRRRIVGERRSRVLRGKNTIYYVNTEHPITKGASNFTITDEVYWDLQMMPEAHISRHRCSRWARPRQRAAAAPQIGRLIPQIWVYQNQLEGGRPYRAFVSLLGPPLSTFFSPHVRGVLLRGIAWAGNRNPDSLATPRNGGAALSRHGGDQPAARRGSRRIVVRCDVSAAVEEISTAPARTAPVNGFWQKTASFANACNATDVLA